MKIMINDQGTLIGPHYNRVNNPTNGHDNAREVILIQSLTYEN